MLTGIKFQARPTPRQKLKISQWMGCARFIWNAKCQENSYLTSYARKYLPIGTYAPVDQTFSQYKSELSPWLNECPSQILRNSSSNWYKTYRKFIKGVCGKPKKKKKSNGGSIHLTRELFGFERDSSGKVSLFIGTKRNNIGCLNVNFHTDRFAEPKSIHLKKKNGIYTVSFCYDDDLDPSNLLEQQQSFDWLKGADTDYLHKNVVGIDRGVKIPVQAGSESFFLTPEQKRSMERKQRYIRQYQKRLSKQKKASNRRNKTKQKLAKSHEKVANIRKDFCHKASKAVVANPENKVIVFEDLKTKNMTKKAKAKKDAQGKWQRNGRKAKAGLNKVILNVGWHQFESFVKYKSYRAGKAWFKINPHHTSQECAACGHTHPDNRESQSRFCCKVCGHTDNADRNAAEVIKKRAIDLLSYSGTELSDRGVLFRDTG